MLTKNILEVIKKKYTKKLINATPILIHIEGVQGSGKSYICSKIVSSKCLCIDIDDMDLEIKNYLDSLVGTPNEMPLNFDSLGKVWKDKLEEKIALEYNAGKKIIVIVGVKRIYMKNTTLDTARYKYFIKLNDLKTIYRRVFIRETNKILDNGDKIKAIINNPKIDENEIDDKVLRLTNLALPYPFDYEGYENNYKRELDKVKKAKYNILTQDKIIAKIQKIISKL